MHIWWYLNNFLENSDILICTCTYIVNHYCLHLQAIDALKEYPSQSAVSALSDAITNSSFYYHVRIKAIEALAHVSNYFL